MEPPNPSEGERDEQGNLIVPPEPDPDPYEPMQLSARFGWQDDDEIALYGPDGKTRETEEGWLIRLMAKPDPRKAQGQQ